MYKNIETEDDDHDNNEKVLKSHMQLLSDFLSLFMR